MALELHIVQQPHEINFSGNPIQYFFSLTPYGLMEQRQDIQVQVRVEREISPLSDIFQEVKSETLFPDKNGSMFINIASICDAYLEYYTPRPSLLKLLEIKNQSGRFRVVIVAQKDGQLITTPITSTPVMVLKGGISYEAGQVRKFFQENISVNKKPLHFFTGNELVSEGEKKYLTWLYPQDATTEVQRLVFKAYMESGPDITQVAARTIPARKYGLYTCPIGLNDLRAMMPTDPYSNLFVKYEVSIVTDTDFVVVAPITFYVDHRNFYSPRQIIYSNSPGGRDTLRILGEQEYQADYSTENAVSIPPPSGLKNAILQAQDIDVENVEIEKFTGATDFISADKVDRLRDLLLSRSVYELKNGQMIPIRILKRTVKFWNTKDDLLGMSFDWQHAFSNRFYTPQNSINADNSCPAVDQLIVRQVNKRKMQVVWSLPMPYDLIEVEISNGTPAETVTVMLQGNTGSELVEFNNPAVDPATAPITVKARIICDFDVYPENTGPYTTVLIDAYANSLPIANDDTFSINMGYSTPQTLTGNVLDNDYDPDDDLIEVVAATGPTNAGGTYSIDAAGVVLYTPPSTLYNGTDWFDYTIREQANPSVTATARVRINVGNINLGDAVYVKLVERDRREHRSPNTVRIDANYFLEFYADPLGTIPRNLSGLGITVNVRKKSYTFGPTTNVNAPWNLQSTTDTPTSVGGVRSQIYGGEIFYFNSNFGTLTGRKIEYSLLAGTGYVPIS